MHSQLSSSRDERFTIFFWANTIDSPLAQFVRPISFRISLPDLDIFIRRGQHFSLRGNLHGPRFTEDREFIPGLPRYSRPVRRLSGYDIRRGERSSWLLGVWTAILRHLDRFRRYVQHCLYSESLRNLSRSLHSHKGPAQVKIPFQFLIAFFSVSTRHSNKCFFFFFGIVSPSDTAVGWQGESRLLESLSYGCSQDSYPSCRSA